MSWCIGNMNSSTLPFKPIQNRQIKKKSYIDSTYPPKSMIITNSFTAKQFYSRVFIINTIILVCLTHICRNFFSQIFLSYHVGCSVQWPFWPFLAESKLVFDPCGPKYQRPHMGTLGSRGYVFFVSIWTQENMIYKTKNRLF